jgi:hypothetical protein
VTRQLGIEKRIEDRCCLAGIVIKSVRINHREREPLPPERRAGARFRGMRGDKSRLGKDRRQIATDIDEVVTVDAVAMQQDN